MNIENEYKEFNDYWNETIKGDSWTILERQAGFMGWIEAKKRALNLYSVSGSFTADDVERAYDDGYQTEGEVSFDIENYR